MQLKGHVFRRHDARDRSPAPSLSTLPPAALTPAVSASSASNHPAPNVPVAAPSPSTGTESRRFFRSPPSRTPANSQPPSRAPSRGPSRAPSPSASGGSANPVPPSSGVGGGSPPTSDPQLLGHYNLRLSELVNKTFLSCSNGSANLYNATNVTSALTARPRAAGASAVPSLDVVTYNGTRLPDRRKAVELAETLSDQLTRAAQIDSYLLRAVARQILRALTMFTSRIDSLMITPSRDLAAMIIPLTAKEARCLPPAMEFNVGLATTAWIVEDALERALAPPMPPFVAELLTPVRKQIEASIMHTISPILTGEKQALMEPLLRAVPHPFVPLPDETTGWDKDLEQRLAAGRLLLVSRIEARTSQDGEGWFISVAVHTLWKALLILSARHQEPVYAAGVVAPTGATAVANHPPTTTRGDKQPDPGKARTPSPAQLSSALKSVALPAKPRKDEHALHLHHRPHLPTRSVSGWSTPSRTTQPVLTPMHAEDWAIVPGGGVYHPRKAQQVLGDLERFDHLFRTFVQGFLPNNLSLPDEESEFEEDDDLIADEEDELARLALAEAVNALSSTIVTLQAMQANPEALSLALASRSPRTSPGAQPVRYSSAPPTHTPSHETIKAFRATPPLILLHILYARLPVWDTSDTPAVPPPHEAFGFTWSAYEANLRGFSANLDWARSLLGHWRPHVLAAARALDKAIAALSNRDAALASANTSSPSEPVQATNTSQGTRNSTEDELPLRRTASACSADSSSIASEDLSSMVNSTPALGSGTPSENVQTTPSATAVAAGLGPVQGSTESEPGKRRFFLPASLAPKKRYSTPPVEPTGPSLLRRAVSPAVRVSRSSTPAGKETSRVPSRTSILSSPMGSVVDSPELMHTGAHHKKPGSAAMAFSLATECTHVRPESTAAQHTPKVHPTPQAHTTHADAQGVNPEHAWALERLLTQRRALTRFAADLEAVAVHVGLPLHLPVGPVPTG